jgi:DNA-binding CsgD family transcriptional regulator
MRLQSFYDVSQSVDSASFQARLVDMANELDFPLVSAALVLADPATRQAPQVFAVGNTPQAYLEASQNNDSVARDPVIRQMKSLSLPFWYDQGFYTSAGAGDLWEEQAAFGYRTGIAVALHLPDHKHFILGVDRDVPLPEGEGQLTRMMADLQLLAVHAQAAAVKVLLPKPSESDTPTPRLTPREVEILRWTMEGKSAWGVGQLLSVSEHTVNFHLRNIFRKLDASSKHQAVLKALALKLI